MEQDFIARTALDELVESDQDQIIKAMVPYLPASGQQFLSVYAKTRELSMLQDIRKCCGGESRRQIDHITSLIATIQMMKIMNEHPPGGENP